MAGISVYLHVRTVLRQPFVVLSVFSLCQFSKYLVLCNVPWRRSASAVCELNCVVALETTHKTRRHECGRFLLPNHAFVVIGTGSAMIRLGQRA